MLCCTSTLTQASMQLSNCDPLYCSALQFPEHVYLLCKRPYA